MTKMYRNMKKKVRSFLSLYRNFRDLHLSGKVDDKINVVKNVIYCGLARKWAETFLFCTERCNPCERNRLDCMTVGSEENSACKDSRGFFCNIVFTGATG